MVSLRSVCGRLNNRYLGAGFFACLVLGSGLLIGCFRGCFPVSFQNVPTGSHPTKRANLQDDNSRCAHCVAGCPGTVDRPVIVIGAGMSGIAAARELRDMHCPVKVIEAKNHMGGRMFGELQEGGWTFNHGANWIHGGFPNPIWAMNKEDQIVRTQWLPRTYYAQMDNGSIHREYGNDSYVPGQELRKKWDNFTQTHAHFQQWLTAACQGNFNSRDQPLTFFVEEYLKTANTSEQMLERFLLYFNVYMTLDLAMDLFAASMVNLLTRSYNLDKENLVIDPYSKIVEHLSSDLDIVLGEPVSIIEYDDDGVRIQSRGGNVYLGTIAIVTVPIGVLREPDISFKPPLPPWKQRTIANMDMGLLEKIAFVFDEPWWEQAGAHEDAFWRVKQDERDGFRSTASEWYNLHNLLNKTTPPVLLTTPGGYYADSLEFASDDEIVGIFHAELQRIFPDIAVPQPTKMIRTKHRQDEFMRGSYFAPRVGTDPLSMKYLAEPVADRIFFAGEATSTTRFGYVDGAYVSGLTAAKSALALCHAAHWPLPMQWQELDAVRPPDEMRIRREWRSEVQAALDFSIHDCDIGMVEAEGHSA